MWSRHSKLQLLGRFFIIGWKEAAIIPVLETVDNETVTFHLVQRSSRTKKYYYDTTTGGSGHQGC